MPRRLDRSATARLAAVLGLALVLALLAAPAAQAGYNEGLAAQQKGDFPAAIKEFTPLAKAGNGPAQLRLAEIYFNGGKGIDRDIPQGMTWLRKAAAAGNVDAIVFLGRTLLNGELGQPKDVTEGVRLLDLAATKANDTRAMAVLAPLYLNGTVVPKDEQRAVVLFTKLGELGSGPAWRMLAAMAHAGEGGLSRDPVTMARYLVKGASLGDAASHFYLGQMYLRGDGVDKNEKEGVRLTQLAADAGDFNAMLALASLYIGGEAGLSENNEAAFKWLTIVLNRAPPGDPYFRASQVADRLRVFLSSAAIARAQEEAGKWQPQRLVPDKQPAAKP